MELPLLALRVLLHRLRRSQFDFDHSQRDVPGSGVERKLWNIDLQQAERLDHLRSEDADGGGREGGRTPRLVAREGSVQWSSSRGQDRGTRRELVRATLAVTFVLLACDVFVDFSSDPFRSPEMNGGWEETLCQQSVDIRAVASRCDLQPRRSSAAQPVGMGTSHSPPALLERLIRSRPQEGRREHDPQRRPCRERGVRLSRSVPVTEQAFRSTWTSFSPWKNSVVERRKGRRLILPELRGRCPLLPVFSGCLHLLSEGRSAAHACRARRGHWARQP